MEKTDIVSKEVAIQLRDLKYNEDCLFWRWNITHKFPSGTIPNFETIQCGPFGGNHNAMPTRTSAPCKYEVRRWFKNKYGLYSYIFVDDDKTYCYYISYFIEDGRADKPLSGGYKSEEIAEDALIAKLIEEAYLSEAKKDELAITNSI